MVSTGLPIVYGGAVFGDGAIPYSNAESADAVFDVLSKHDVHTIDSAQLYSGSEEFLGKSKAGERFTIDTKIFGGFAPGSLARDKLIPSVEASIKKLDVKNVDVLYIHAPDKTSILEEWTEDMNTLYKRGLFKRFGLSNFEAKDVQAVYDHAKAKGYVLPTVYQGNYNAVARKQETILFPTLRKLGIAFYAYSPVAGGFLTKSRQQLENASGKNASGGRWDPSTNVGELYIRLYLNETMLKGLEKWGAIADEEGISKAELAYRWIAFSSPLDTKYGDKLIVGSTKVEQLEQTFVGLEKGPLSAKAVKQIDDFWATIEHVAPVDNFNG